MKVSIDKHNSVRPINFKGYETEKSRIGGLQYTFNFPYDTDKYDGYVELCVVKKDGNGNYNIISGLPNKNIDVSSAKSDIERERLSMALPLKSGKTVVNLSTDYGISEKSSFGYHFKLVPKNGGAPIYQVDAGDIMDLTNTGKKMAHDLFNIVVPGSEGSDTGSAILLIPDSYNAMYTYDKDGKIQPNLKYLDAIKATKHFSNKMGGTLAGIEHDLDAGKFDNYTKIVSTPLFTDDSLTPHSYWNINCMQMANSLGNIKNYQSLQKKLFARGINWVSDGAFVNEGLQGVHFRNLLKWGVDSPYFNWFRASELENNKLKLGVFPKNPDFVGLKVVNAPYIMVESPKDGTVIDVKKNKYYDKNKPTYIQVFDKRLVTADEAADNTPLIKSYSKLDTGNTFDIVTHHDTIIPYSFEVNPETLTKNMEDIKTYNKKVNNNKKLTKNSYQAIRILSKFENFVLDEKIEGGFDTWDANVDIAKINYVYSKEDAKKIHDILNDDNRREYNEKISQNNTMTQDYAITSAAYWTKLTNQILRLHVAQNLKNVDEHNASKIIEQIKDNITKKQVFPVKLGEAIDETVVDNILEGIYELKEHEKLDYKDVVIAGMMDLPLDSIELGDNIVSVFASPFLTKWATTEDDIGKSRYNIQRFDDNTHLNKRYQKTYMAMNDLYEKEMYNFANNILLSLNKKLPENLQINDGLNPTEYGKYVLPFLTSEIAKFAIIKGLFPDATVKIDEINGGIIYDYDKLKETSLQQLGINANSPEEEAELLVKQLKGSKLLKYGIPAISDKDKQILVNALYKMIEGTNVTSFKLAEVIVDRSRSGLDWRIDATKDIADVESLRKGETDFEDTWGEIINFWSKFAKAVYQENPNSYLVAEVTNEVGMYDDAAGKYSPKYKIQKDIVMKFLRETSMTSIANYGFFFTSVPCLFAKRTETGEDWGLTNYEKVGELLGKHGADFLHSGPLPSLISSYTFADNHDKPRLLHGLAMDMQMFYADLTARTDKYNENSEKYNLKLRAYKILNGQFMPSDTVEPYKVHNFDFSRVSPKAVAMGEALGNAFQNALNNISTGSYRIINEGQQHEAYIALAAAIKDLVNGTYDGHHFQAEAFGVRPFDIAIEMVVNQAVKHHGLKFNNNISENNKVIKSLKQAMFSAALEPAITKALAIMKFLVALPGNPTLFAGDDIGSTGYEQLTKNIYLQNRSTLHYEWLEDDSPDKLDFIVKNKAEFDKIMATRKRLELHPLNDGAPYLLQSVQCKGSAAKVNALLRQSTDGSMTISLFNISGANHDFRYKNSPQDYPVRFKAIELNRINVKDYADAGLRCGLKLGLEFVDSENPDERYVVVNGNDPDHYQIKKKDGGDITMSDNTKILYYVSPETEEKIERIKTLQNAIDEQNKNKPVESDGTFKKILNLKKESTSFKGRETKRVQLYNPQYNFISQKAYDQNPQQKSGSKLSLLSR